MLLVSKMAVFETGDRGFSHSVKVVPDMFYFGYCGWVRFSSCHPVHIRDQNVFLQVFLGRIDSSSLDPSSTHFVLYLVLPRQ
jgi:hypothetical protein